MRRKIKVASFFAGIGGFDLGLERAGFTADTLTHIVNALYKRAQIHGGSSHSGRRTFITKLAEQGVGARVLQKLCGHQNLATTQQYIDLKPSMLRAAVELI